MISPDFNFEKSLLPPNCRYLLGIDEVGRGPLAGPVTVGAFLLDLHHFDPDIFNKIKVRDSKKLSNLQRSKIFKYFKETGQNFKTFSLPSDIIDRQGIAHAIHRLVESALHYYQSSFDFALVDGNYQISGVKSVIKGDQLCFSVASAAICAKEVRDSVMDRYHQQYPQYGFSQHKGYGTKTHLEAIIRHGPCPIHRLSFAPLNKTSTHL